MPTKLEWNIHKLICYGRIKSGSNYLNYDYKNPENNRAQDIAIANMLLNEELMKRD